MTLAEIRALCAAPLPGDDDAAAAVAARQAVLTKPPGSLGGWRNWSPGWPAGRAGTCRGWSA